jgi:hypothetical protein
MMDIFSSDMEEPEQPSLGAAINAHKEDHHICELHRYFNPVNPAALHHPGYALPNNVSSLGAGEEELGDYIHPNLSGKICNLNTTLMSFAKLAALQLDVERVIIRYRPWLPHKPFP